MDALDIEKSIDAILKSYFEFCLTLLQNVPSNESNIELLANEAYRLRKDLKEEIRIHFSNLKSNEIFEAGTDIALLRKELLNKV